MTTRRRPRSSDAGAARASVPDYDLAPTVRADSATQLKAMADPLRTTILHLVLERAATTGELAEALGRPNGTVAHHLKVLEAAGLVRVVRTRRVRAMTERFWGRTGRTILIGDPPEGPYVGFMRTAMEEVLPGDVGYSTLRHARVTVERVDEFVARLDALALEFASGERGGTTVYGLMLALYPTAQPILPTADGLVAGVDAGVGGRVDG